jgi:hypothetical protein
MPCFSTPKPNQTKEQRKAETKKVVKEVDKLIGGKQVQVKVGPQGAITFIGLTREQRDGMSDICIYNQLMTTASEKVKTAIRQAEMLAGRTVSKKAIAQGWHSHDGGATWGRD